MASEPAQKPIKPKYFFLQKRPSLSKIPQTWARPPMDEYVKKLKSEGFLTISLMQEAASEALKADCRELDQHLMPHFWQLNQQALFYQNRYYLYQWIFIIATFCTTALAAFTVLIYHSSADIGLVGSVHLTDVLGVLTAIASGSAATVAFLAANENPQQRWFKARSKAESLRSLYFLFLARQAPFDVPNAGRRVHTLRLKVLDTLRDGGATRRVVQ